MGNAVSPLRTEPLLDPSGGITLRYAEYFDLLVSDISVSDNSLNKLIGLFSSNEADIAKLQAVNSTQKKQIDILIALAQVDRQNIAGLISDNGKMRARINELQRDGNRNLQLFAYLD